MMSPASNNIETEKTLTTLTLDVIERLTILEQSFKFADLQRGEIARKVDRLTEVTVAKKEVQQIALLVNEHERFFNEFKFGLKVAKAGWAIIYIAMGTVIGTVLNWYAVHH